MKRLMTWLCVATLAMVGFTAAPASAAIIYGSCVMSLPNCGIGSGNFIDDGDRLLVCDSKKDGKSVVVKAWDSSYQRMADKWHTSGAGPSASDPTRCTERSWGNLPEGTKFYIQACSGIYSPYTILDDTCGQFTTAYA